MEKERCKLQRCPECGGPAKLRNRDNRYWYECDHCWTKGRRCVTEEEAAESWNAIKPKPELQRCPNCGCSASINNRNHKYWYECNGCWTQGDKCSSVEEARKAWNAIEPRPKKTNFGLLQEMGELGFAKFMLALAKNHEYLENLTEDDVVCWLNSVADSEVERFADF